MSDIKFETINGQLCRMVEPTPLQLDSELPCVVRLIRDGTQMGKYNKDMNCWDTIKDMLWITLNIKGNPLFNKTLHAYEKGSNGKDSCIASIHQLEIIGYPVVEGSAEWALYQAENGKSFEHKTAHHCRIFTMFSETELKVTNEEGEVVEFVDIDRFLSDGAKTGWQIYNEPEPKFKVGDWVEVTTCENIYQDKITFSGIEFGKPHVLARKTKTLKFDPYTGKCFDEKLCVQITRKLSPSEVEVDFGFAKGRILSRMSGDVKVLNNKSVVIATIIVSEITNPTIRSLVESLLKAQKEEK